MELGVCTKVQHLRGDFGSLVARGVAREPVICVESAESARTSGRPHERIPGRIKGRIKSCSRPAQKWCERSGAIGSIIYE